jgi:hypothetical protein
MVLLITLLTVVPGVVDGLVVYCGRGAVWLGRRRCHTRASGFCVEVLPVDICTVSAVGSMAIVCGEGVKTKCVLTCYLDTILGAGCPGFAVECIRFSLAGCRADELLHV